MPSQWQESMVSPQERIPHRSTPFWPSQREVSHHPNPCSPPTQLDGLIKPLLIHGLLHILSLWGYKRTAP